VLKIRLNLCSLLLLVSTAFPQTPNCGCEQKPELNVLAVVNGVKITKQDLSIDTRTQVSLAQEQVINARAEELGRQINQMLLNAEAKRRGLAPATIVVLEVKARVIPPTEEDARAYYEQNRKGFGERSFSSVKKGILAQLTLDRQNARAFQYLSALRAGAQITGPNLPVTPPVTEEDLDRVFATVNGVNITSRDVEESLLPLIFMVQEKVYELRKRDVDIRINDLLLNQEAKRLGTSPEALLNLNVKTKTHIVTEEQVRAYYEEHKADFDGNFAHNKLRIMQLLQREEERKQFAAYAEELRKGAAVQIYLTAPTKPDLRQLCCNPVD
jgi:hypothetical protein